MQVAGTVKDRKFVRNRLMFHQRFALPSGGESAG